MRGPAPVCRTGSRRAAGARTTALCWAAVGTLAATALAGCTPPPGDDATGPGTTTSTASPSESAAPVSVVGGTRPEDRLLALVMVRHLQNRGIPAVVAEPSSTPWETAGDRQVAVVDSLAMAAELAPVTLAGPVPTPSATASPSPSGTAGPSGTPSASPSAPASDPAPPTPTGHPTETGSPTPLPDGSPAADAADTTEIVAEYFPEDTAVIGSSTGTLRLQAVTTTALSGLYGLDDITDLNGLCDRMVFTPRQTGVIEYERLEVLAGCEPAEWTDPGEHGPAIDLVAGRADVALLYGTDPAITDHALDPLADPDRILPEGRMLVLAEPGALPDGATAALQEVSERLDGDRLAELQRLTTGPDALPPAEAAQYWLVTAGLEEAPDGWI